MSSGHVNWKRMKKGAAWLLVVSFLLATAVSCSSLNEHLAMKEAAKAYKAGKYEDAAKGFEKALYINSKRAENWKYLGYSYWSLVGSSSSKQKDKEYTDKALNAFQKYLDIVKKDDDLQDYIIGLYVNQDRIDDGIKYYEAELKKYPNDTRIIQVISTMYTRKGDFANSLKYSEMKANLTPTDPGGYLFIGALCWDQSYRHKEMPLADRLTIVDKGMAALDKALKIDSKSWNAHVFYGLLWREKSAIAKLQSDEEKDRKKKKELLAQSDEYMKYAEEEKNKALEIRKAGQASPATGAATAPKP